MKGRWLWNTSVHGVSLPNFRVGSHSVRLVAKLSDGVEAPLQQLVGDDTDEPDAVWEPVVVDGRPMVLSADQTVLWIDEPGYYRVDTSALGDDDVVWMETGTALDHQWRLPSALMAATGGTIKAGMTDGGSGDGDGGASASSAGVLPMAADTAAMQALDTSSLTPGTLVPVQDASTDGVNGPALYVWNGSSWDLAGEDPTDNPDVLRVSSMLASPQVAPDPSQWLFVSDGGQLKHITVADLLASAGGSSGGVEDLAATHVITVAPDASSQQAGDWPTPGAQGIIEALQEKAYLGRNGARLVIQCRPGVYQFPVSLAAQIPPGCTVNIKSLQPLSAWPSAASYAGFNDEAPVVSAFGTVFEFNGGYCVHVYNRQHLVMEDILVRDVTNTGGSVGFKATGNGSVIELYRCATAGAWNAIIADHGGKVIANDGFHAANARSYGFYADKMGAIFIVNTSMADGVVVVGSVYMMSATDRSAIGIYDYAGSAQFLYGHKYGYAVMAGSMSSAVIESLVVDKPRPGDGQNGGGIYANSMANVYVGSLDVRQGRMYAAYAIGMSNVSIGTLSTTGSVSTGDMVVARSGATIYTNSVQTSNTVFDPPRTTANPRGGRNL